MSSNIIKADNGASSGVTGIVQTAGLDGTLQLQTTTSGGTATTALTINNTQGVTLASTLSFASSAGTNGIIFNNSSASVNSTLNDYEVGSWTPAVGNLSSGSVTYYVQSGTYTKIGNLVSVQFWIRGNTISSPVSTSLTLTGLPFTSDANSTRASVMFRTTNLTGVTGNICLWMNDATTTANLASVNNGVASALLGSNLAANFEFDATFSYRAAY